MTHISIAPDWFAVPKPAPHLNAYQKLTNDNGHLTVFVGIEKTGVTEESAWHLSISHRSNTLTDIAGRPLPGRIPTWDEIKDARYRFIPDEINMVIMLPPKKLYVNHHPTTMHLWEIPIEYAQ